MGIFLRAAVLSAAFIAGATQAQQAQMTAADVAKAKADVKQAMADYIGAFNKRDAKGIADNIFSNPAVSMGANGVTIDATPQVEARYKGNIGNLEKSGWAKSEMAEPRVCVMNANVAFAVGNYTRTKTDGTRHSQGASTYMLNRGKDGKWRIVMLIGHDQNKVLSCND